MPVLLTGTWLRTRLANLRDAHGALRAEIKDRAWAEAELHAEAIVRDAMAIRRYCGKQLQDEDAK